MLTGNWTRRGLAAPRGQQSCPSYEATAPNYAHKNIRLWHVRRVGARFIAPTPVIASPPPITCHAASIAPRHLPPRTRNRFGFDESNPYGIVPTETPRAQKTDGAPRPNPARTRETPHAASHPHSPSHFVTAPSERGPELGHPPRGTKEGKASLFPP